MSAGLVPRLRALALRGLARMYRPGEGLFAFRVRPVGEGIVREGFSRRYTAIALIGLAGEEESARAEVLGGRSLHDVAATLLADVPGMDNLGDVALSLWAARAVSYPDRRPAWERLLALRPQEGLRPAVELAWALAALCQDTEVPAGELRHVLARRLVSALGARSTLFPHVVGANGSALRSHVACFADLVYPIHALSQYFKRSGDAAALEAATRCARQVCRLQGAAGQWWWHYDERTGEVLETYPVYAVHQDAMAPMALFALQEAAGLDFRPAIAQGLAWLERSPELEGGSLLDARADLIWRKVARREPGKLSRYLQAGASWVHPGLRTPGLDRLFPPRAVDFEDRPYHLGWLLHAWPAARAARWAQAEGRG
jgi:hypothetical protein